MRIAKHLLEKNTITLTMIEQDKDSIFRYLYFCLPNDYSQEEIEARVHEMFPTRHVINSGFKRFLIES